MITVGFIVFIVLGLVFLMVGPPAFVDLTQLRKGEGQVKLIAAIFFYAMFIAAVVGLITGCEEQGYQGQAEEANGLVYEVKIETSRGTYWCLQDKGPRRGGLHCEPW